MADPEPGCQPQPAPGAFGSAVLTRYLEARGKRGCQRATCRRLRPFWCSERWAAASRRLWTHGPIRTTDRRRAMGTAAVACLARPSSKTCLHRDTVVGDGSPASCTSEAFVDAVALGGVITFDCGPEPIVITLDRTAKVFNDQNPDVVIDGGGKVTLSGGGRVRILYQNACDPSQVWTTSHCNDQDHPRLTVQNLTFVDGNAKAEEDGGGAIFVRGGRFKAVNTRFFNNVCHDVGPDVGGGGDSGLRHVPGPAGVHREQHLWRGRARERLLERRGAQLDRRVVHGHQQRCSRTTRPLATAPTHSGPAPQAAGAAAPSTTTAIPSRSPSAAR